MPAYNTGAYIESSILSILTQSFQDFELLIIDDGSTDDTESKIKLLSADNRIKYFKKKHTGISDTLNYGLKKANNEIVARLDSDDIAMPYRLAKQLEVLKNNKVDIVSGAYAVFKENKIKYIIKNPVKDKDIKKLLCIHSCVAHSGVMYKKSMVMKTGGYFQTHLEDYDLWLRLRDKAVFYNLSEVVTLVRYRKNSESYNNTENNNLTHIILQNKYIYKNPVVCTSDSYKTVVLADICREYYYGNKLIARKKTKEHFLSCITSPKILISYIISYVPFRTFEKLLNARLVPRLRYLINYFNKNSRESRNILNRLYSSVF